MTTTYKEIMDTITSFIAIRVQPGSLSTRKNREISSGAAYRFKVAVEKYTTLSEAEKVLIDGTKYGWKFRLMDAEIAAKVATEKLAVAVGSELDEFDALVWEQVRAEVEVRASEYAEHRLHVKRHKASEYAAYEAMSRDEQRSRYPGGFFNTRGSMALKEAYLLTLNADHMAKYGETAKQDFIARERGKLKALLFRIIEKLGIIRNIRVGKFARTQLIVTVDTDTASDVEVNIFAIVAGGYNIQRAHYRWLTRFYYNNTQIELK